MNFRILFLVLFISVFAPAIFVFASTTIGTIDSTYKYAWAQNTGWINFGCANCNVNVTDSAITGKAWSDNYGWINLNPTNGGVKNDGNGNLSGKAWGENLGWIDFTGVKINSSGQFTGTATGDITGTVNFNCTNCKVLTDWRAQTVSNVNTVGGGNTYLNLPAGATGFQIFINNGNPQTNNPNVNLTLNGGQNATSMDISNYPDFKDAETVPYATNFQWVLTQGDGAKTVYARFHGSQNQSSGIISANIILNTKSPDIKVGALKNPYLSNEDIIVSGQTDANSSIIFAWNEKYGSAQSDSNGNWLVDLGQMDEGAYALQISVTNQAGNKNSVSVNISVQNPPPVNVVPNPTNPANPTTPPNNQNNNTNNNSILQKIKEEINSLLHIEPIPAVTPIITVPKEVPNALRGKWNLLPVRAQNIE